MSITPIAENSQALISSVADLFSPNSSFAPPIDTTLWADTGSHFGPAPMGEDNTPLVVYALEVLKDLPALKESTPERFYDFLEADSPEGIEQLRELQATLRAFYREQKERCSQQGNRIEQLQRVIDEAKKAQMRHARRQEAASTLLEEVDDKIVDYDLKEVA